MTGLFGWLPRDGADPAPILTAMACALRATRDERWSACVVPGLGIGVLDGVQPARVAEWAAPVWSDDRRHALWLVGEIYEPANLPLGTPQDAAGAGVRRRVLALLLDRGVPALDQIDGEFLVAWWDADRRQLRLLSDRFGGRSCYWAATTSGVAFAHGVRGVLMAPGVSCEPDLEALRDATTFGGYRLGTHTNVASVRMFPAALDARLTSAGVTIRRYWRWSELSERPDVTLHEAAEQAVGRWRVAVRRRVPGAGRVGVTLSGGLDSRLVLAELVAQQVPVTTLTYGLPGSDDVRYARRAARAAGVPWLFHPLYSGDWLRARTEAIQRTDGLIQLGDLMHLEAIPRLRAHMDTLLSGYLGDVVAGPSYGGIRTRESLLLALPYYGTSISRGWADALARLEAVADETDQASSRFFILDHKHRQATNRWLEALRPYVRVRKPFLDWEFFVHCQSLPWDLRGRQRVYEVWLRRHYPDLFARIPNQRTGVPVLAPSWRLQAARVGRLGRRAWVRVAKPLGLPGTPWSRMYVDDEREWNRPGVRERIEATVLRPGSIAAELFGRRAVADLLAAWTARGEAPAQVVGALYVYERYHADLPASLADARRAAAAGPAPGAITPC